MRNELVIMWVEKPCMYNQTLKSHSNSNIIHQAKAEMCKALGISYRIKTKQNIFYRMVFTLSLHGNHVHTNALATTWHNFVIGRCSSHRSWANWEQWHPVLPLSWRFFLFFQRHKIPVMFHVFWPLKADKGLNKSIWVMFSHCSASEIKIARTAAYFYICLCIGDISWNWTERGLWGKSSLPPKSTIPHHSRSVQCGMVMS